jgi:hypothetical protein
MDRQLEQKIRERAYELWVKDGRISGRADDYWYQAEQEIRSEAGLPVEDDRVQTGSIASETLPMPDDVVTPPAEAVGLAETPLPEVSPVKTRKKRTPTAPKPDDAAPNATPAPKRRRSIQVP